ncbi:MAG: phosphoribosylamine--glycine ligase [Polyangiales bacterium]|jgi:phosphoribosylamine--glycine ligase
MPRVLILGSGAREHALAYRLSEEAEVHVTPGNGGTSEVAVNHRVSATDIEAVVALALSLAVDLVIVGPEAPLVAGVVDALVAAGIPAFGPSAAAARLEGSKIFSKELMAEREVPTADFAVFDKLAEAKSYVLEAARPLVVKADGLAAGKGVVVAKDTAEALAALDLIMGARAFGEAGDRVLIEEVLPGQEVSFHVVCAGESYIPLACAQDHKRAFDGDEGPNTGGMGAYSPVPFVTAELEAEVIRQVVEPTLAGMMARGTPFSGVLFIGLMVHEGSAKVLEYNVRFGDPECEVLMARWGGSLYEMLHGAATGTLISRKPEWDAPAALSLVLASGGYPGPYPKGLEITGMSDVEGARVFHAGTARHDGSLVTAGGRVMAVTATGPDVEAAAKIAYRAAESIHFDGLQMRRDIGWQARTS